MRCPFCHDDESKVTDSRMVVETNAIRRRRECCACSRRFTTFETLDFTLQVLKRDGCYEDFSQEKIVKGMDAACLHTSISKEQVRSIVYQISVKLMENPQRDVTTKEVGEIVMGHLQELDLIAYIRFACVYRRFKHVDELMDALERLPVQEGNIQVITKETRR